MSGKCCLTCKWKLLTEDDYGDSLPNSGRRVCFDCGIRYSGTGEPRRDIPCMLTVVEREHIPSMKKETSFMATFCCCYWEKP